MYLKKLSLSNFRNYKTLEIEMSENTNIIYGDNGLGKTNILEGIYVSAITKSYRAQKDMEYIKFNEANTHIESCFVKDDKKSHIDVFVDVNGVKQIKEDGLKVTRYTEFIGKYPLVLFSPEDMEIVKGSPKNRRKFLDILISQISKKYVVTLGEYKKTLNIKNNILKLDREKIDLGYLRIINEKLAHQIVEIVKFRKEYIEKIQSQALLVQQKISEGKEKLEIVYDTEFLDLNYDQVLHLLESAAEQDIMKRTSNKGIGRDDFTVLVNESEVAKFGSQGQNRTAVLALKIAEAKILTEEKETMPLVLLDDVFSELDNKRISFLLEYIKNFQTVITTTTIENIKIEGAKIFDINELAKN